MDTNGARALAARIAEEQQRRAEAEREALRALRAEGAPDGEASLDEPVADADAA